MIFSNRTETKIKKLGFKIIKSDRTYKNVKYWNLTKGFLQYSLYYDKFGDLSIEDDYYEIYDGNDTERFQDPERLIIYLTKELNEHKRILEKYPERFL
jgi:hypothetical protein